METIKEVSQYAIANKEEFAQKVRELSAQKQFSSLKEQKSLLTKKEKRYNELKGIIKKLYESYATEKISEKNFEMLSADYQAEQENLETEIKDLQSQINEYKLNTDKSEQFIELAKKYTDFSVLTTPMLNEFIEKIIVHAPEWDNGKRTQELDIYFNFIGNFQIPISEPTPEEIAEMEEKERLRLRDREYGRRYREKKKAKKFAEQQEKEQKEQKQADEKSV